MLLGYLYMGKIPKSKNYIFVYKRGLYKFFEWRIHFFKHTFVQVFRVTKNHLINIIFMYILILYLYTYIVNTKYINAAVWYTLVTKKKSRKNHDVRSKTIITTIIMWTAAKYLLIYRCFNRRKDIIIIISRAIRNTTTRGRVCSVAHYI